MIFLYDAMEDMLFRCRPGDEDWSWLRKQMFSYQVQDPVFLNGRIYALCSRYLDLVQIEVDDDDPFICKTTVLLPESGRSGTPTKNSTSYLISTSYLVASGDHDFYRITVSEHYRYTEAPRVNVAKFDFDTNSWVQVSSLNGGALFLDQTYSLSLPSSDNKWSYIYFTSPDNSRMLFSYRMEDEKTTSYSPYPTQFPGWCSPSWIMPAQPLQTKRGGWSSNLGFGRKILEWIEVGKRILYQVSGIGGHTSHTRSKPTRNSIMHCSKKQKIGGPSLSDLPPDLLGLISECIPSFVDYIHFLSVHYAGNDVVRTRKNPFHPCLIYRDKANGAYHITDSTLTRKLSVEIPQALENKNICCSCDGWLLMRDSNSFSLFNPFTTQILTTQGFNFGAGTGTGTGYDGLGVSNVTLFGKPEDFSVLTMSMLSSFWELEVGSCMQLENVPAERGKAELWSLVVGYEFHPSPNSPVRLGEEWYYLGCNGKLGCVNRLGTSALQVFEDLVRPCHSYRTRNYLTECGGELVSVFIGDDDDDSRVRVFKMNQDAVCWEEIHILGGYCLYVGWPSSMSCIADSSDMADRIYFPKFYKDGLIYYSLKTKKYHSVGNDQQVLKSSYRTTTYSDCAWIKLEWNEQS